MGGCLARRWILWPLGKAVVLAINKYLGGKASHSHKKWANKKSAVPVFLWAGLSAPAGGFTQKFCFSSDFVLSGHLLAANNLPTVLPLATA